MGTWPVPWGRGQSTGQCVPALGSWPIPCAPCGRHRALPVSWALCGRCEGVAGPLGPVWRPWRRGLPPAFRVAAVKAWAAPWFPCCCRGSVAEPMGSVLPTWGRGWFPRPCRAAVGRGRSPGPRVSVVGVWLALWVPCGRRGFVAGTLDPVWLPWGRGRSPEVRVSAVGSWPVSWAPCVRREGVVCFLGIVCLPRGRGLSTGPSVVAVEASQVPWSS